VIEWLPERKPPPHRNRPSRPRWSFPKEKVLTFRRYANRRDLLSILLEDGKEYTHDQIDGLIKDFYER